MTYLDIGLPTPMFVPDDELTECFGCGEEGPVAGCEPGKDGELYCPPCIEAEREGEEI